MKKVIYSIVAVLFLAAFIFFQGNKKQKTRNNEQAKQAEMSEDWHGDDKEGVAKYLKTYQKLPDIYMTKAQARKMGWEGGALNRILKGKAIGGDSFGNYEKKLPKQDNDLFECDIDTLNRKDRGAKRIIYSNDKEDIDIWYTDDHYESFTLLYGDGK